jgi:CheY-like chemotaxis protein
MQSKTVLLVEDNTLVADVAAFVLKREGFTVLLCKDYPSAIAMLTDINHLDLLFTDVLLPDGKVGTEIAALARKKLPDLPVLFSSGYTADNIPQHMLQKRGMVFLQKPYKPCQLLDAIQHLFTKETS